MEILSVIDIGWQWPNLTEAPVLSRKKMKIDRGDSNGNNMKFRQSNASELRVDEPANTGPIYVMNSNIKNNRFGGIQSWNDYKWIGWSNSNYSMIGENFNDNRAKNYVKISATIKQGIMASD